MCEFDVRFANIFFTAENGENRGCAEEISVYGFWFMVYGSHEQVDPGLDIA